MSSQPYNLLMIPDDNADNQPTCVLLYDHLQRQSLLATCSTVPMEALNAAAVGHETLAEALADMAVKRGLVVGVLQHTELCVSNIVTQHA